MKIPRVIHVSPFLGMSGANQSLLVLAQELVKAGPTFVFALADGELAARARETGATVITAFEGKELPGLRLRRWARITLALDRAVRQHRIELIHGQSAPANRYALPVARLRGVPLITHQRDNYARDYFHAGLGFADAVIANSRWVYDGLPGRIKAKATVVHNAAATPPDAAIQPRNAATLCVGLAGRCVADKGQDLLIEAALSLMVRHNFEVLIRGIEPETEYGRRLQGMVAAAPEPVRRRIRLEPFDTDMAGFYNALDIVAIPSRYPEPFGRVAIEAMAWRKPVIVAGHGGLVEIVSHERTGLICAPGSSPDLAVQLERLLTDEGLRRSLGEAGREEVETRFSPAAHARQVVAVYDKLLCNGAAT